MTLRFHNTLSRTLEPFQPREPGHVRIYTCGPTVYDRAHIGNFRTFVWEDLLRRYLQFRGYEVEQVMNLTDVDDRTIGAAAERGTSLAEITEPVIEHFHEDWQTLGLAAVEHSPRATAHVPQMIEIVKALEANGYTYEVDGSVYFAIDRLPGYGRLVNLEPADLGRSERIEGDEEYTKENPRDFVLWKGGDRDVEGDVATWDSPWGPGRPGWHLECSAMAIEYLGPELDIHTGGVDNIFPHHTNEMAQSEAATGRPFARYWLHAEHLLVDGAKMSKSLGNFYTIPDLLEAGYRPSAIRYLLLSAHYRKQLNFTLDGLVNAERALDRLEEFRQRLQERNADAEAGDAPDRLFDLSARARDEFEAAMDDDLNVSDALGAVFTLVRDGNRLLDGTGPVSEAGLEAARGFLRDFDSVFGVMSVRDRERTALLESLQRWVADRVGEREDARRQRDWARADAIRDELQEHGIVLEDGPEGTRWRVSGAVSADLAATPQRVDG